jgi:hypothetical protein
LEWLSSLSAADVAALLSVADKVGLDSFEIASLHDLDWFRKLSRALIGPKNLPDCFHLWTARRNHLDVFLTLEKKLPRTIVQIKGRSRGPIDAGVAVLRPTPLLQHLGVSELDAVPVESGRFYTYMEVFQIRDRLLKA